MGASADLWSSFLDKGVDYTNYFPNVDFFTFYLSFYYPLKDGWFVNLSKLFTYKSFDKKCTSSPYLSVSDIRNRL